MAPAGGRGVPAGASTSVYPLRERGAKQVTDKERGPKSRAAAAPAFLADEGPRRGGFLGGQRTRTTRIRGDRAGGLGTGAGVGTSCCWMADGEVETGKATESDTRTGREGGKSAGGAAVGDGAGVARTPQVGPSHAPGGGEAPAARRSTTVTGQDEIAR